MLICDMFACITTENNLRTFVLLLDLSSLEDWHSNTLQEFATQIYSYPTKLWG